MPTVLLIRHGRTEANSSGVLAGRTAGVRLDDSGTAQARALAARLAPLPLAAVVSSPLDRCLETAAAIVADRTAPAVVTDERLTECGYGEWTGRALKELRREKLWRLVQGQPSAARFPGGESLRSMQARAVEAVREHDANLAADHGGDGVWAAVSHGDVIKSVLADALGLHLDLFQRLIVDPGSVSVVTYTDQRPFVVRLNDTGSDLSGLRSRRRTGDAVVGGGDGTQ